LANKKRKQLVVDRSFQFRFVSTFLFSILGALVLFSLFVGGYYWLSTMAGENLFKEFITIDRQVIIEKELIENGVARSVRVPTTETIVGVKRWELVLPAILVNNLIIMILVSIIGIYYSHRIAGPVYRINLDIRRILDGETGVRIRLRSNDGLQDLARMVNLLAERLEAAEQPVQE
jgi:methyl-accepting chemotaxis protein